MENPSTLLQIIEKYGLQDDPQIKKLTHIISTTSNPSEKKRATKKLRQTILKKLEYPFKEKTPIHRPQQIINIGRTHQQKNFYRLTENQLTEHTLTAGQSGSGKTNLNKIILNQLSAPFWIYDFKKDYRYLSKTQDTLVLPVEKLRFNPLKPPPGTSPKTWLQLISEIIADSQKLLAASTNFLKNGVNELYKENQVYTSKNPVYPTLIDLHQHLKQYNAHSSKQSNYQATVINRLNGLKLDAYNTFQHHDGYPLEQLLQEDIVYELDTVSSSTGNLITETMLAWLYQYRKNNSDRGNTVKHVILIDEAKTIFSRYKEKQVASGLPVIDDIHSKIREFRTGVVASDQEPQKLTETLLGNTDTKILLPTATEAQFKAVADSMNLTRLQKTWAKTHLDTGMAIVQTGNLPPCPVDIPKASDTETVSDEDLKGMQSGRWQKLLNQLGGKNIDPQNKDENQKTGPPTRTDGGERLEPEEFRLLKDIAENPFKQLTERYQMFSSKGKAYNIRKNLTGEWIQPVEINKGDSTIKLFRLTSSAETLLEDKGVETRRQGKGSLRHQYWQHQAKQKLEGSGFDAVVEEDEVDVAGYRDGEKCVAVEIGLSDVGREVRHLRDRVDSFDQVLHFSIDECFREELEDKAEAELDSVDSVVFQCLPVERIEDIVC